MLGRTAGARFDRERKRFDRRELHFHRAARFVLLFPQPRDDRVVAAEDEVERHGEQREPSEPAARQDAAVGERGKRGAREVARRAPRKLRCQTRETGCRVDSAIAQRRPARCS